MLRTCKHHGETEFRRQTSNGRESWYCRECYTARQRRMRYDKKNRAVAYKGGCCSMCGYKKCVNALEFHHTDPSTKEVENDFMGWSWKRIQEEIDKCILVCSNCHREIHAELRL